MELDVAQLVRSHAPADVQGTVAWWTASAVSSCRGGGGSFGAELTYQRTARVTITVDRGQWSLDVAGAGDRRPGLTTSCSTRTGVRTTRTPFRGDLETGRRTADHSDSYGLELV